MQPIFLFSLPRAGSTLLQRILAGHPEIMTTSESWALLPSLYALKEEGVFTEYGHLGVYMGVNDFIDSLPLKNKDYFLSIHDFMVSLYHKQMCHGERYFLDKTPRYHLIVREIMEIFPEGKFIFLWRNPLAIISSILDTWGGGRWNLYRFYIDLYEGVGRLTDACDLNKNNIHTLRYEDLISNSAQEIEALSRFLELDVAINAENMLSANDLQGRMGDPTGIHMYSGVSSKSLDKWKLSLANPFRKYWCRKYLRTIGGNRLQRMGFDISELLKELNSIPSTARYLVSDIFKHAYGFFFRRFEFKIMRYKNKQKMSMGRSYFHY